MEFLPFGPFMSRGTRARDDFIDIRILPHTFPQHKEYLRARIGAGIPPGTLGLMSTSEVHAAG
jgi:hypothetical protein